MTKAQILLYLAIGNLSGALLYNPPARAWDLASWVTDSINGIHDSLALGRSEAQTPLPVPQGQPPIGNSTTIQPCAAPPPISASSPVAVTPISAPSPVQKKVEESGDRTIWVASRLKYPQSLKAIVDRFGTPSISTWDTPRSFTSYTTQTGRTITFEVNSFLDKPDVVTGYSLQ